MLRLAGIRIFLGPTLSTTKGRKQTDDMAQELISSSCTPFFFFFWCVCVVSLFEVLGVRTGFIGA